MSHSSWLLSSLIYLAAAVIVVPLAQALGLGSIIGYLMAGIAIGPYGLGLVGDTESILHFAEFGVVLMLFLIGLELEPRRLWSMRRPIFGWGSAQMAGCALAVGAAGWLLGAPAAVAVVAALGLAMSSTAATLQVLGERNLLPTSSGQAGFSILLLQDVAAIPILAIVPLLAHRTGAESGGLWLDIAKAVGVIAAIVVVGRLLLRQALRWIARRGTPEIFTAAALLLVVGIASLMQAAGLSMALGAFLGGVLLAESEFKRELETDVEPFKGLLLGLFFMAVGMSIEFKALAEHPLIVAVVLVGFMALKAVVLALLARAIRLPLREQPVFVLLLAQGGEFAFVVFQSAASAQVLPPEAASVLIGAVALSMLFTPLLLLLIDRFVAPRLATVQAVSAGALLEDEQQEPVIIAGFGRYGQIVARLLYANGLKATVLDHDAEQVEGARRFGSQVYYGDATRLDLLRSAGAARARVLVVAVDDVDQSLKVVDLAREHFPQLQLVVRARNVQHYYALRDRGVTLIERETLDAALASGRSVLELMGWHPHHARQLALRFRRHSVEQLERAWPHHRDEAKLIAITKQGRQQLEELFAQEREQARLTRGEGEADDGWGR
ncbi:MAG: glutathione-regulated potassium-efflux system protein KefC [Aquabacterium sp.]|nr:MAG: glutathione-regulated potassium-efflux system protein KefC [Aquabacterium sp.]